MQMFLALVQAIAEVSSGIIRHGSTLRPQPQLCPHTVSLPGSRLWPALLCTWHLCVAVNEEVLPAPELYKTTVLAHLWLVICFFSSSLVCTETFIPSCAFRK